MPLTGDSAALRQLAQKIRDLGRGSSDIRRGMSRALGEAAMYQLQAGFEESKDPYGQPWAPLKHPSRKRGGASAKPLRDTGRLLNSYSAQPTPSGFRISTKVDYAPPHQYGATIAPHSRLNRSALIGRNGKFISAKKAAKATFVQEWKGNVTYAQGIKIPKRQMVPEESTGGLGKRWGEAIDVAAERLLHSIFGV